MSMSQTPDDSASISREQLTESYLNAFKLIDKRVTPFLGKATTRVLVQVAARHVSQAYPCLAFLEKMPYTDVSPSIMSEQCHGTTVDELHFGLYALLQECFRGLKELTGDLIEPPLHEEVSRQLGNPPQ